MPVIPIFNCFPYKCYFCRYYIKGDTPELAVDMYISNSEWDAAHKIALTCMKPEEIAVLFITHAQEFEKKGLYKESEKYV